jgi:hypothetical protein
MPLLLAQKENRKEVGPGGVKFHRKDYLVFGRKRIPYPNRNGMGTEEQE